MAAREAALEAVELDNLDISLPGSGTPQHLVTTLLHKIFNNENLITETPCGYSNNLFSVM